MSSESTVNQTQESHQISPKNEARQSTTEVALGGVILGGTLGIVAAVTFLLIYCALGVIRVVHSTSHTGADGAVLMVFATTLVITVPVGIICAALGGIGGGVGAWIGCVLTFSAISPWMRPAYWLHVARAYRRGMLYGSVLGMALQPVLWWLVEGPPGYSPTVRLILHYFFGIGGLIPLTALLICLQIGGAIAAVRAIFELRAGYSPCKWRELPYPFDEW